MNTPNTEQLDATQLLEENVCNGKDVVHLRESTDELVDLTVWVQRNHMDDVLKNLDDTQHEIASLHKTQIDEQEKDIENLRKQLVNREKQIFQLEQARTESTERRQLTDQTLVATEAELRIAELQAAAQTRSDQIAVFQQVAAEKDSQILKLLSACDDETMSTVGLSDTFVETSSRRSSRSEELLSHPPVHRQAEHSNSMLTLAVSGEQTESHLSTQTIRGAVASTSANASSRYAYCESRVRSVSPVRIVAPVRDESGRPLRKTRGSVEWLAADRTRSHVPVHMGTHPARVALPFVMDMEGPIPTTPILAATSPLSRVQRSSTAVVRTKSPEMRLVRGRSAATALQLPATRTVSPVRVYVRPQSPVRTIVGGACAAWQCVREPSPIDSRLRVSSPQRALPTHTADNAALSRSTQRLALVKAVMERQRRRQEHALLLTAEPL